MTAPTGLPLADLVAAWGRGRAVSRATAQPEPVPGGFQVAVGDPSCEIRQVLHTYTPASLAAAAARLDEPDRQLMIAGPTALLREAVPATWTMDDAGHLMTVEFRTAPVKVPEGYRLVLDVEGALAVARIFHFNGDLAASARLGRTGSIGVFDKVVTAKSHRRRGLGTAVMHALTGNALLLGMERGLLVASDDGRALYSRLGWDYVCDFPGARSKRR